MTQAQHIYYGNTRRDFEWNSLHKRLSDLEKRMVQGGGAPPPNIIDDRLRRFDGTAVAFGQEVVGVADGEEYVLGQWGGIAVVMTPDIATTAPDPNAYKFGNFGVGGSSTAIQQTYHVDPNETGSTTRLWWYVETLEPGEFQTKPARALLCTMDLVPEFPGQVEVGATGFGVEGTHQADLHRLRIGDQPIRAITGGDQGAQRLDLAAAEAMNWSAGQSFTVTGSTGNDGTYTVASSTWAAGTLSVVTVQPLPDATFDGNAQLIGEVLRRPVDTNKSFRRIYETEPLFVRQANNGQQQSWPQNDAGPYYPENAHYQQFGTIGPRTPLLYTLPGSDAFNQQTLYASWAPELGDWAVRLWFRHPTNGQLYMGVLNNPNELVQAGNVPPGLFGELGFQGSSPAWDIAWQNFSPWDIRQISMNAEIAVYTFQTTQYS